MNVILLLVAVQLAFIASFCQRDGSFSPLDSPSSTEWDEYVTSDVSCTEDDEWWSDSSCSFCRCKCETRSSNTGVSETMCVSRCYDYSDSSSYSAIYQAADYCGYDCDYYSELSIDYTMSSCDCDSIKYSCYNYTDSSTDSSTDHNYDYSNCTAGDVTFKTETYTYSDAAGSTETKEECLACYCFDHDTSVNSGSSGSGHRSDNDTATTTEDNTNNILKCDYIESSYLWSYIQEYCNLDCSYRHAVFNNDTCECPTCDSSSSTGTDMPSTTDKDRTTDVKTTTGTDDNTRDYSTTADGSRTETKNTDMSMSSTEDGNDDDSIYNDGESETVPDSDADYSYLYIKLGLQVTRIWDSRSEVWDILRKALRDVMSNSPDYDADTTNIYFLYWDAYKVDDDSSTTDDVTTGSTSTTNDDEPTTTTISVTSVDSGGRRRRRRSRALLEDSTRDSEEITVQFYFSLAVYFGNSDDAQDWYDYLTSLGDGSTSSTTVSTSVTDGSTSGTDGSTTDGSTSGTDGTTSDDDDDESFGTRYVGDCDDEARTYDTNGWGTITLTEAYIGLYDSDGTVIEETSYSSNDNSNTNTNGNSDTTVPSSSSGNSGNSIYGNVNSVLIVTVFAIVARFFVW